MPKSSEQEVVLPVALHARPAGLVVKAAAPFRAEVKISYGDRTASARGVLAIMGLGADAGATVLVRAEGEDAAAALDAVTAVLAASE